MTNSEKLFLVLAEELNFRRAAKRSFLSQQCLSDHIRRLEENYGTPLFTRKPSVSLTPAGIAAQHTLQLIKNLEAGLASQLEEIENGASGTIRMGVNYTRARLLIPALFERYHSVYPHVHIELILEETSVMQELLEKGKIDFFLGVNASFTLPVKAMLLADEAIYLIASAAYLKKYLRLEADSLINMKSEADLRDFQGLPFVMNYGKSTTFQLLNQYISSHNIMVETVLSVSDYNVSEGICRSGGAAAFCPQIFLPTILKGNESCKKEDYIFAMPIHGLNQTLRFDLIYNGMTHYPKFTLDCFKILKQIAQEYLAQTTVVVDP